MAKDEAALRKIIDILTNKKLKKNIRLSLMRKFKLTLNKRICTLEAKLMNDWSIESFLDLISTAAKEATQVGKDFQDIYKSFLLNLISHGPECHEKIRLELLQILKTKPACDSFVANVWMVLEKNSLFWLDVIQEILASSKLFFEKKVFDWVKRFTETNVTIEELKINYYAQLSVHCCDIFQIISTILNEFVILMEENERVMVFLDGFISLVSKTCEKNDKQFFTLYPRDLIHFVSLLTVPPDNYSIMSKGQRNGVHYQEEVLDLLLVIYSEEGRNFLQVLTHFPEWFSDFVTFECITSVWEY